jgi:16S rRNA (cytosine967-C5)-methyltransferase
LGHLLALDVDAERLHRVSGNLKRLNLSAQLAVGDAGAPEHWWDGLPYDRILLDAPCSATGVIRRHPDIKVLRQAADIAPLARRQRLLLERLWPLLTPGGMLVYATCSLLKQENELVIADFLAAQADADEQDIAAPWGRPALHGRQILPGEGGMDGFFYARLSKRGYPYGRPNVW